MKILLADDHPLVLMGIHDVLVADGGFEIVGTTCTGPEVLPLIGRCAPDVVLLDVRMPKLGGLQCLTRIRARYPNVKVVMISMFAEPEQVQLAFNRGACGYVVKSIEPQDLGSAIRQAVDGTAFHAFGLPALDERAAAKSAGLTERELTIVKAVARGLSNQNIGKELWVTEQTVKFHLTNVYKKLGIASRTEAAGWAFANGFADEPTPAPATAVA